ncbi:Aste57867_14160 [Aphanomyces stellatus]|uniref:Aste57867_14160 protein n=1 Tax=Aphanomyces stellatus TaxID=120398 RepID=A0A485L0A9_9STRA|nr:hypothetical protein As57867_014109 [Aphanomyces stellatus]VFT90986.1 Aste57867_14160 [Aphanomyces stellatus]
MSETTPLEPVAEPDSMIKAAHSTKEIIPEVTFTCQVCFDPIAATNEVTNICNDSCPGIMCPGCIASYLKVCVQSAHRGILTRLNCPICIRPLNMHRLESRTSNDDRIDSTLDRFRSRVEGACEMLCPECHEPCNMLPEPPAFEHAIDSLTCFHDETWPTAFLNAGEAVAESCLRYCNHHVAANDLLSSLEGTVNGSFQEFVHELIGHIYDAERRATLFLALMKRYPFEYTPCCSRDVCFTCKRDGHHEGEPCNAYLPAVEEMAQCPDCDLILVKGDGCSSITCFCGYHFEWEEQVAKYRLKTLTIKVLTCPSKRAAFRRVASFLRDRSFRRKYGILVVAQIPSFVLQLKLTNISPVLFYPPWSTNFRTTLNDTMRRRRHRKMTARNRQLYSDLVVSQIPSAVAQYRLVQIRMAICLAPWVTTFKAALMTHVNRRRYSALVRQVPDVVAARVKSEMRVVFQTVVASIVPEIQSRQLRRLDSLFGSAPWSTSVKSALGSWVERRRLIHKYSAVIAEIPMALALRQRQASVVAMAQDQGPRKLSNLLDSEVTAAMNQMLLTQIHRQRYQELVATGLVDGKTTETMGGKLMQRPRAMSAA